MSDSTTRPRARDLGIPLQGRTGKHNAITDVQGVTVGHETIIAGEGARHGDLCKYTREF